MLKLENKYDVMITHEWCNDGMASVAVAMYNGYINNIDQVIFESFGKENINISSLENLRNKKVLIVDFSYDRELTLAINEVCDVLHVVDHHATARRISDLDYVHIDESVCGAKLLQQLSGEYKTKEMPLWLEYVNDRDLFKNQMTLTKTFYIGFWYMYTKHKHMTAEIAIELFENNDFVSEMLAKYNVVSVFDDSIVKEAVDKGIKEYLDVGPVTVCGIDTVWVNNSYNVSEVCAGLYNKLNLTAVSYSIVGDRVKLNIRSPKNKSGEARKIAEAFGGGGHDCAAGCKIPLKDIDLSTVLTDRVLNAKE